MIKVTASCQVVYTWVDSQGVRRPYLLNSLVVPSQPTNKIPLISSKSLLHSSLLRNLSIALRKSITRAVCDIAQ